MTSLQLVGFAQHVLARDGFDYNELRCIMYFRCHGLSLIKQVETHFVSTLTLVDTCYDASCDLDGMGQHMLRCILCVRWQCRSKLNACRDAYCVLAGMSWVWSTHVEIRFVCLLACD